MRDVTRFGLVVPGALYDQTEFLRPGFRDRRGAGGRLSRDVCGAGGTEPQLIALGLEPGESFPDRGTLNPARRVRAPGRLLLIPFAFVGPVESSEPFHQTRMEQVLLHECVASS